MNRQPFFAVRVVVEYDDGSTVQRDYVRGEVRMGYRRFASWALGDLLMTVGEDVGPDNTFGPLRFKVFPIEPDEVYEQRRSEVRQ